MIHTIYSNSYEVLRAVLMSNIDRLRLRPEAGELSAEALFRGVFDRVPVIIPSKAVETDLRRAIAKQERICAGMEFMFLSQWLGFLSKEPLANLVGDEGDWMIWRILRETGPGSLREEVKAFTNRLEDSLEGRSDMEIFMLAQRIASVFVSYSSYRLDWVLEWVGLHQEHLVLSADMKAERRRLEEDPDLGWQRALWRRLARATSWRGWRFLEVFPEMLERLSGADRNVRAIEIAEGRTVMLPNALHVFCPFVVSPLMLPVLKAYAHSGRDVWLYLLNPCAEYWFDLVPRRLFRWREEAARRVEGPDPEDDHREIGHPLLADNGRSTRANIDRLWRFTAADEPPSSLLAEGDGSEESARRMRELPVEPRERHIIRDGKAFLRRWQEDPKSIEADLEVDVQSFYLESNEPTLLRRIQDSVLNLRPEDLENAPELVREEDESLRFVCAPTAVRELEGLVDWLQARFHADPTLRPDDVLVVTPDIASTAPLVDQVFGSLPEGRRIAYRITGVPNVAGNAPLGVVTGLVRLLCGRMRREELLSWVALPIVSRRFGIDGDDLDTLAGWLEAAGMDFGLSDGHLLELDAVTFARVREGTLERALERLALGAMLPAGTRQPLGDALPVEGAERVWTTVAERPRLLSALSTLFAALENLRRLAQDVPEEAEARDPKRWTRWVSRVIELVFPRETPEENWQALRDAADVLSGEIGLAADREGTLPEVPFPLFFRVLENRMTRGIPGGRPGSGVTFTGMRQMRGLPWRIIAVVGLGENSSFPGSSRSEEFDLMARHPRRGDRDSRSDNRNIFLDLLLAARDAFLVSWTGGSDPAQRREPSVVARELLDWIVSIPSREEDGPKCRARRRTVLTRHLPLTGFSPAAFEAGLDNWRSTDAGLLRAVEEARRMNWAAQEAPFADHDVAVSVTSEGLLPLEALCTFWSAPERWFLKLHAVPSGGASSVRETPFLPEKSGLASWKRRNEYLAARLAGGTGEAVRERWNADPGNGARGVREWALEEEAALCEELSTRALGCLEGLEPVRGAPLVVTLPETSGVRAVRGTPGHLWRAEDGSLRFFFATPSRKDGGAVLRALLQALFLQAAGCEAPGEILCVGDAKEPKTSKKVKAVLVLELARIERERALELLGRFAGELIRAARSAPAISSKPFESTAMNEHPSQLVFRGLDLEAARKKREELVARLLAELEAPHSKSGRK